MPPRKRPGCHLSLPDTEHNSPSSRANSPISSSCRHSPQHPACCGQRKGGSSLISPYFRPIASELSFSQVHSPNSSPVPPRQTHCPTADLLHTPGPLHISTAPYLPSLSSQPPMLLHNPAPLHLPQLEYPTAPITAPQPDLPLALSGAQVL